jgi:hypothetical protein
MPLQRYREAVDQKCDGKNRLISANLSESRERPGVHGQGQQGPHCSTEAHLRMQLSLPPFPLPQRIPIASLQRPFDVLTASG